VRTHGTYQLRQGERGPEWALRLDPAVRMRARRMFGKVQLTRTADVVMADTDEVCRDLAWFSERFPLEAADERSRTRLEAGAAKHLARELAVQQLIVGQSTRLQLQVEPAKPARDYQLLARELLRTTKRYLLTDEVGLGKTYTGLLCVSDPDARPALIVPPTHLPPRWADEWQEAFPDLSFAIAKKSQPTGELKEGVPDLLVVPYSKIDGWAGYIHEHMRSVIFDEVQELRRGRATAKGAAAGLVADGADYVIGLSATPIYNYGGEIWNVYDIVAPDALGTREEFNREWCKGTASNGQALLEDPHALGSYLRDSGLMLGRTRADVGRELPKTIKVPTIVDSYHDELDKVAADTKALAETILSSESSPQEKFQAAGEVEWSMRRATGVDKAPFVADFVRLLLESEDRVVMWGWHRDVYDIWLDRLKDFHPAMYTGSESPRQKSNAIADFTAPLTKEILMSDGSMGIFDVPDPCRVLIMSLRSGAGVDGLQKVARVGVFGELDWSPQIHEQAIGRLRRDGMGDDPPVAYFLYSAEGSDPVVLSTLQLKREQAEPLVSKDGLLLQNATTDQARGRRLAEQILGRTRTATAAEGADAA
jgi:hypothetical protein